VTPIALVTPWFGPDTRGGAEDHARTLACTLRDLGADIEVWTTTSRDSYSSRTGYHYPPGLNEWRGLRVRRWAMNPPAMGTPPIVRKLAAKLKLPLPDHPAHEINLLGSLPNSTGIYQHIVDHPDRRCIFMPYPMGMSYWGSFLAQGRAYHIPCLHDEPYAYYSTYRAMLRRAELVLFNSHPERELGLRLYDLDAEKAVVAGEGIELNWVGDARRFVERTGITGPILLYVGRYDFGKNVPQLVSFFREWKAETGRPLTFVRVGPGNFPVPKALSDWVVDLGFITPQEKHDAYAAATVFCQLSTIESFSIVLMESWLQGTPALVNADCPVTSDFSLRSGAGIPCAGYAEWAVALTRLLDDAALRQAMGAAGKKFVEQECRWDEIARRMLALLSDPN
jgi:glycosyltransferase involved in cell wall biosynthesis